MKKKVIVDRKANKEIGKFPRAVRNKFRALFKELRIEGKLKRPFAKKMTGQLNLFEMRVNFNGQWRAFYAYFMKEFVIILSAFRKKTQKTPNSEINKAIKRLQKYRS